MPKSQSGVQHMIQMDYDDRAHRYLSLSNCVSKLHCETLRSYLLKGVVVTDGWTMMRITVVLNLLSVAGNVNAAVVSFLAVSLFVGVSVLF